MPRSESTPDLQRSWHSKQSALKALTWLGLIVPFAIIVVGITSGAGRGSGASGSSDSVFREFEGFELRRDGYVDAGRFVMGDEDGRGLSSPRNGFTAVRLAGRSAMTGFVPGTAEVVSGRQVDFDYVHRPTPDSIDRVVRLSVEMPEGASWSGFVLPSAPGWRHGR